MQNVIKNFYFNFNDRYFNEFVLKFFQQKTKSFFFNLTIQKFL